MSWKLAFSPGADRDFARLDSGTRAAIARKLDWLVVNFDRVGHAALHGGFEEYRKLRIGDYRIAYRVSYAHCLIYVDYINRRDKIYKRKGWK